MPVEISNLTCERAVYRRHKDGTMDQEDDDWKSLKPSRRAPGKWKGFADFFLTKAALKNLRKNSPSEEQVLESGHYMYEVLSPEVFAAKRPVATRSTRRTYQRRNGRSGTLRTLRSGARSREGSPAVRVLSLAESLARPSRSWRRPTRPKS